VGLFYTPGPTQYLGAGLCEAEDIINEEQHVLSLLVPEVLGDGESGQCDTGTGAGRLIHLTVDQRHLRLVTLEVDDAGHDHLVVEVVALAGALADAGEDGVAAVGLGDVVDQLHDEYGLTHAGTTKQTYSNATKVRLYYQGSQQEAVKFQDKVFSKFQDNFRTFLGIKT